MNKETVWFDVTTEAETEKAFLFHFDEANEAHWIPKSACGGRRKDDEGKPVRIEIKTWCAKGKGLTDED